MYVPTSKFYATFSKCLSGDLIWRIYYSTQCKLYELYSFHLIIIVDACTETAASHKGSANPYQHSALFISWDDYCLFTGAFCKYSHCCPVYPPSKYFFKLSPKFLKFIIINFTIFVLFKKSKINCHCVNIQAVLVFKLISDQLLS